LRHRRRCVEVIHSVIPYHTSSTTYYYWINDVMSMWERSRRRSTQLPVDGHGCIVSVVFPCSFRSLWGDRHTREVVPCMCLLPVYTACGLYIYSFWKITSLYSACGLYIYTHFGKLRPSIPHVYEILNERSRFSFVSGRAGAGGTWNAAYRSYVH
jgi:hypothetical protein